MARFREQIAHFLAGEVSPRAQARVDLETYKNSCEELTNMLVLPQGGAMRRPGAQYVGGHGSSVGSFIKDETNVRLIPFVQDGVTIVLAFTTRTVAAVAGAKGIDAYRLNSDGTVTQLAVTTSVPFSLLSGAAQFLGFSTAQQLREIQYTQFGRAMFFVQKDHPPFAIQYDGTTDLGLFMFWAYSALGQTNTSITGFSSAVAAKSWPFLPENPSNGLFQVTPSATTGNITIPATTVSGGFPITIYNESMVGHAMRITNASNSTTGVVLITSLVSPSNGLASSVNATVLKTLGDTSATVRWCFSDWRLKEGVSNSTVKANSRGNPGVISFYENRLYYGSHYFRPNGLWASRIGNLGDMRQAKYVDDSPNTVANDDPYDVNLTSNELSQIVWMSAGKTLQLGSTGREFISNNPDSSQTLGPLNVGFQAETAHGGALIMPARQGNSLVFIPRNKRRLREFVFNFQEDSYKAADISTYAEHMPKKMLAKRVTYVNPEIVQISNQEHFNGMLWVLDRNGGFYACTRDRDQGYAAFHWHELGGVLTESSKATPPKILSFCVAPNAEGTHDDIWLAVRRTINGADITYLERINKEFELEDLYNNSTSYLDKPIFSDSAKIVTLGSPGKVFTGFSHLIGQTVSCLADGIYHGEKVVDGSGQITLDINATELIAGLKYRSLLKTSNINLGSVIGSAQGANKSIDDIVIRFNRTVGAKFGSNDSELETIEFRTPDLVNNAEIPLFTGDRHLGFQSGWSERLNLIVAQDLPLPLEVEGIFARGVTND